MDKITQSAEQIYTITTGRGTKESINLTRETVSLNAFFEILRKHIVYPSKEDATFIIPGHVAECPTPCRQAGKHGVNCGGGRIHRLALNVKTIEALFLDFDTWNSEELEQALARVEASGYRFICYSSASYAPPDKAKARIVFPLSKPCDIQDNRHWRDSVWPALVKLVGLPDADRACADASRPYYLPTIRQEGAPTFVREGGSKLLEVPAFIQPVPLRLVQPSAPRAASSAELIAQLRAEVDFPEHVEIVERIAEGSPLATEPGSRHPAINKATWLIARLNPRPDTDSVIELLKPSLEAMGDERDFFAEAVRGYEGACSKQEEEAPEVQDFRQRLEEQAGTDKAFAQRLVREHGEDARFLPGIGWHVWDGRRFEPWGDRPIALVASLRDSYEVDLEGLRARITEMDEQLKSNGAATTMVAQDHTRRFVEKRNRLAAKADKFHKTCIRPTQTTSSANSILRMAEEFPTFRADVSSFDANTFLLNCNNGMVDLRTGELKPHDPAAMCTKLASINYNPDAKAPLFERVLSEALPDAEVRGFFQRVIGYSLTGDVSEHLMLILLGAGGNGKSTLLNAIASTLGDYAGVAPKSLLMFGNKMTPAKEHELADLRGKRFVQMMELGDREHLDTSRLKAVVGGDRITAARKYENAITFVTEAKMLMACNSLPRITDEDNGAWRRLALIEFPNAFLDQKDETIPERLKSEAEGILAWAVRGCLEWQRTGVAVPEKCRKVLNEYREEENDVARFVNWFQSEKGAISMMAFDLYEAYTKWCQAAQIHPRNIYNFAKRLKALGLAKVHTKAGTRWSLQAG